MTRPLNPTELKRLHREWRRRTSGRLALVLDGVMTPVNVGSITRLAAAYGVERMWLAGATASVRHPGAGKTAMGTDRFLDVIGDITAVDAIHAARDAGLQVVGIELTDGAVPLFDAALHADVCLVVGHEDHGLSAASIAACDLMAYLPLVGRVGSLNVATATGIALAEVRRRHWQA
ncbi:MAG: TrmH family RNA methyltransferase [Acidimicrobiales bacterium]